MNKLWLIEWLLIVLLLSLIIVLGWLLGEWLVRLVHIYDVGVRVQIDGDSQSVERGTDSENEHAAENHAPNPSYCEKEEEQDHSRCAVSVIGV